MARIRTIKPGFFASEDVSALPFRARLAWVGLWTQCDDHGRTKDNVKLIKAAVWPLDDVSLRDVEEDLQVLAAGGRIVRYRVGDTPLLAVVNWHAHQSINRPGRPRFPGPSTPLGSDDPEDPNHCRECSLPGPGVLTEHSGALTEDSLNTHGVFSEDSRQEGKGKERNVGDQPREDVERVCNYLAEWIVRNGSKPPTITEKWRTEARLLIDKDGRSLDEIRKVTAWSQRSPFWKPNILSMPKLREKFDQLRLAMESESANGHAAPASNAPKSIPPAERCEKHPNYRRDRCGPCRSERGAKPATTTTGRSE